MLVGPHAWAANHYRLGMSALERYHSADAKTHFEACLTVWKNNVPARIYSCRAARRLGEFDAARGHLKECQRILKGTNAEVALEDALLRVAMGDLGDLEKSLRSRMDREPEHAALILEALAEGYSRMYRLLECSNCIAQWLSFEPDNPQALYLRGRWGQQVRTWDKAATDYRKVLEIDPDRSDARESLVLCLLELSRYEEALRHLEVIQRKMPDDLHVQVRIARCRQGLGEMKKARQILHSILEQDPDNGQALLLLGRLILNTGQPGEAEADLHRAAEIMPFDYEAQWQLYQCLNRQEGKSAEAQSQLALAEQLRQRHVRRSELTTRLSVRPHDASLHYEMGLLMMQLGNKELGARWLSSALHEKPDYPEARDALIAYFEETNRPAEAEQLRQDSAAIPGAEQSR
jgi:tetratricopeptide (TPR) repeat protein